MSWVGDALPYGGSEERSRSHQALYANPYRAGRNDDIDTV
jgi:hypothetical protein